MSFLFRKKEGSSYLPGRHALSGVKWLTRIALGSYIVVAILYFVVLGLDGKCQNLVLKIVSVIEMILSIFSIILSLLATHISDRISATYVNLIKRINRNNETLTNNCVSPELPEETVKQHNTIRRMKFFIFAVFSTYLIGVLVYNFSFKSQVIGVLLFLVGAISTILSTTLAWVSSFMSYAVGKDIINILETLKKNNIDLFALYNNQRIDQSYEKKNGYLT